MRAKVMAGVCAIIGLVTLSSCSPQVTNLADNSTASASAAPRTVMSWPTLGNHAFDTAMETLATALWNKQTGSTRPNAHELFAGDDPAGVEPGQCSLVVLAAPEPSGGLSIGWFRSPGLGAPTDLAYLGQTSGLEADLYESIYTYGACPDIKQIPNSPMAIPEGMPALPDDELGVTMSIAAPEHEVQGGVGQDFMAGSEPAHGPALVIVDLIISSNASLALLQDTDPQSYDVFTIPFTPPAP